MKRPGPLLTLLAGLLLAVFMLSLNATTGTDKNTYSENTKETGKDSPAPTAPTNTSPSPSTSSVPDASYAGRTDDDSSAVALTLRDGRAIAYFCDGRVKESWLKGDVKDDGTMKLTGRDGSVLNGTLEDGRRVRGTVDVGGGHYAFTADRAEKPSGLYRATATVRGAKVDGGWIVLPDGRQVGVVTRGGRPSAAPEIDPVSGAVTVDGRRLTARPATP